MRFRRKPGADDTIADDVTSADGDAQPEGTEGPYDADTLPSDDKPRVDLGALLVPPSEGRELRMQVDQKSGEVRSVLLAGKTGALELRAYAAPRHGDLWSEIRPQIAADAGRRGGTATEREGRFGTEVVCEVQVTGKDGAPGRQTSRVIGVNGSRWLLRATLIGEPARDPESAAEWEDLIAQVAVRRGDHAMPVGEQLPLSLPEGARRVDRAAEKASQEAPKD